MTLTKDSVVFPSGIEITNLGDEARCMECHQGRASTIQVDQRIADAGLTEDLDTVSPDMGFTNIHYYAAAATQYGTLAKGGYEYAGLAYDAKFDHVDSHNTCIECHDMHTLEINLEQCQACATPRWRRSTTWLISAWPDRSSTMTATVTWKKASTMR